MPAIAPTLREAKPLDPAMAPRGVRPPFSLIFVAAGIRACCRNAFIRLEQDGLGALSIFWSQSARMPSGATYQAVFN